MAFDNGTFLSSDVSTALLIIYGHGRIVWQIWQRRCELRAVASPAERTFGDQRSCVVEVARDSVGSFFYVESSTKARNAR